MWEGSVVSIQIAPRAAAPMVTVEQVEAEGGKGLVGDRYFHRVGKYSERPRSGRQVTLIEIESIEALAREAGVVKALVHRAGLRADILVGGTIRVGDPIRPE